MRLKTSHAAAREAIFSQAEEGFALKLELEAHGYSPMGAIRCDEFKATVQRVEDWRAKTIRTGRHFPAALRIEVFPLRQHYSTSRLGD